MRFFRDALFAILAALATSAAAEGVLRLAHARYEGSVYQAEALRGYGLRPNAAGWETSESPVWLKINSDGMRDRERTYARAPGSLRIAVIGSSAVESITVPLEADFESLLEARFNGVAPPGKSAEVLNFGVAGYDFAQDYLTLKTQVWKYHPQVVIAAISLFEILKNTRALYPASSPVSPFYELQNGQLVPDAETSRSAPPDPRRLYWKNLLSDFMNHSAFLGLLNEATRIKLPQELDLLKARLNRRTKGARALPGDYLQAWSYFPDLPATQTAWSLTEAFLAAMKAESDRHHAEFWVMILGDDMQIYPNLSARAEFVRRHGIVSLEESDRRVERFCNANSIQVLPLAPGLADFSASHHVALKGQAGGPYASGHWNELGHRVAAGLIGDTLISDSAPVKEWLAPRRQ